MLAGVWSATGPGTEPTPGPPHTTPHHRRPPADALPDPGPPGGRPTLLRRLPALQFGLAGQVLTFLAMVVPILLHAGEQVAVLVFTSAIASGLVGSALLGYQFVYPVIRGPHGAAAATRLAFAGLTGLSLLLLPLTLTEPALGLPRGAFAAASALLFTMGLNGMALTQLVRDGDARGIGVLRLSYGVAMLGLTVAASLWSPSPLGLTLATAVAYLVPAVHSWGRRRSRRTPGRPLPREARRRLDRAVLRRAVHPTFSSLATGWAFFLPGIALPGLGVAAQPWAIITRICGGFTTVLQTLVAPPLEARMAKAVRDRDRAAFARARRLALTAGALTSLAAMATGLALAVYENAGSASEWFVPVTTAMLLFFGLLLATAPINRTANFVGRDVARLVWDAVRALLVTGVFLCTDGVTRLVAMGVVLTVFGLLLLPLTRYRSTVRS